MPRSSVLAACALTLSALAPLAQAGPVTYRYEAAPWSYWADNSGHNFPTFANPGHAASLEFTVAAPLAANLGSAPVPINVTSALTSWRYDGGQPFTTVDSASAASYFTLYLWTGAQGEILESKFYIANAPLTVPGLPASVHASLYVDSGWMDSRYGQGYLQERVDYPDYVRCQGYNLYGQPYCYGGSEGGHNPLGGGRWTVTAATVNNPPGQLPEPGSLALALAGLLGLGGYSPARFLRARLLSSRS